MNKPNVLIPFIYVYRMVLFIFILLKSFVKYIALGFFFINITLINATINILTLIVKYSVNGMKYIVASIKPTIKGIGAIVKYAVTGSVALSYAVYLFFKLVIRGFIFTFVIVYDLVSKLLSLILISAHKLSAQLEKKKNLNDNKRKRVQEERRIKFETKDKLKEKARLEKITKQEESKAARMKKQEEAKTSRIKKQEAATIKRQEQIQAKKERKKKLNDEYRNENVEFEKKKFGDYIDDALNQVIKLPINLKNEVVKKYNNLSFVKNARNKKDINHQEILLNFDGEDAERSETKILYEYVGKNSDGKVVKGHFEAFSKVEVHSFLLSEGFEVYSIRTNRWIVFLHGRASVNTVKIKTKDLIFFLTQLSTYIKAGIPLVDSLKILARQFKNKSYQRIFRAMIYDLTMGESFSNSLVKQGVAFPKILINMIKSAEMTGQLPEVLDDMAEYFTEVDKTRKQMVTAMIYPSIVLIMSLAAVTFIMMFVVPGFISIYESMDADQIPAFTRTVISVSGYIEENIIGVIISFAVMILVIYYLYKNVKLIRTLLQWIAMHLPGFGNIIIYNEVTMFTKTFSSLMLHGVFITDSLDILNRITNNEIFKMLIFDAVSNVTRGDSISLSFENHWAFPIPAYEMLVTGEKTGQVPQMMAKVSDYYQELHRNAVTRLKTLIEPALIVFLTVVVGAIVLAVIIPMFNSFQMIQ